MADVLNINREQEALKAFDRLEKRRLNGKFNFTIIVGNQKIYADQNILSSGSDYFDAMLSHDTEERQNGKVEMKGVDFESVKICIDHIHQREISVPAEKYQDVMVVAAMMQLQVLCDALVEKISENLTTNTFFSIQNLAIMFGKQDLIVMCQKFAAEHFESVSKEENFNTLEQSFIVGLLKSKFIEVGEERKLEVILEWVRFDENRNSELLELLKFIDYSKIPLDVGVSYIKNEPLINTNNECVVFFSVAIIESMASLVIKPKNKPVSKNKPALTNQVVIFGEERAKFSLFDPTESSIKNLTWQELGIDYYSVVNLDGHLYILGEDGSVCRLNYHRDIGIWERMTDMIKHHGERPPATVMGGHIYVIGGHDNCVKSVERFHPRHNIWEQLHDMPKAIQYAEVLGSREFIYSFGGWIDDRYINDVTRLDVYTGLWSHLSPMNTVKGIASAAECGGYIFVAGGLTDGDLYLKTFERYDLSTNEWSVLPQMNIARCWFNLHSVGKFLYAVGGNDSAQSIEKYDLEKGIWQELVQADPFDIAYSVVVK